MSQSIRILSSKHQTGHNSLVPRKRQSRGSWVGHLWRRVDVALMLRHGHRKGARLRMRTFHMHMEREVYVRVGMDHVVQGEVKLQLNETGI